MSNRREIYVALPKTDGIRSLKAFLKTALRRYRLRCVSVSVAKRAKMSRAARSSAARMRSCRERRRNGFKIARAVAYPDALPLALCDEDLLKPWDEGDPKAVVKAIEEALVAICLRNGYAVTDFDDDLA
jgi:hypothetical protein